MCVCVCVCVCVYRTFPEYCSRVVCPEIWIFRLRLTAFVDDKNTAEKEKRYYTSIPSLKGQGAALWSHLEVLECSTFILGKLYRYYILLLAEVVNWWRKKQRNNRKKVTFVIINMNIEIPSIFFILQRDLWAMKAGKISFLIRLNYHVFPATQLSVIGWVRILYAILSTLNHIITCAGYTKLELTVFCARVGGWVDSVQLYFERNFLQK